MSIWSPRIDGIEGPRYLAIAEALLGAIERGELRPGERLPTHRDLAHRLGVSVHTVSAAYAEAQRRGLISGETGRGTFVQAARRNEPRFFIGAREPDLIDLSINRPVVSPRQVEAFRAVLQQLAGDVEDVVLTACRPVAGLERQRQAATEWVAHRGLRASAGQVIICNGGIHALMVALAALTRPGDVVATDGLVDHGLISLAGMLHFRLLGLDTDEEGIVPEAFEAACAAGEIKALCTAPVFNNPTTSLMGAARREKLSAIATRRAVPIIENDVYGMLLPDGAPALSSFDPDNSYYVTSFTKSVISGLRTGYLVAPADAIARLVTYARTTAWMATPMVAEVATRWIEDGTALRLAGLQRSLLAERHATLARALDGYEVSTHPTALHAWLTLPPQWRTDQFVSEARLRRVAVTPAEPFVVGRGPEPHAIRISKGAAQDAPSFERGLATLAAMLRRDPEPPHVAV